MTCSGQGQVAGACECGNTTSGSVNGGEFLEQLRTGQLLRKDSAQCGCVVGQHCDLTVQRRWILNSIYCPRGRDFNFVMSFNTYWSNVELNSMVISVVPGSGQLNFVWLSLIFVGPQY